MSIYASMPAPNDDEPGGPLVYRGSHVLPEPSDDRAGWVDIALIPGHVRHWREHPDADLSTEPIDAPPDPYLRFGVNGEAVVLEPHHVRQIVESLTEWLDALAAHERRREGAR